jgi:uncharacterized protein
MARTHNSLSRNTTTQPPTPSRYKMALLTWAAAFPLLTTINLLFGAQLAALPLLVRTFVVTGTLVSLLSFVILPRLSRLCATWLTLPIAVAGHVEERAPAQ